MADALTEVSSYHSRIWQINSVIELTSLTVQAANYIELNLPEGNRFAVRLRERINVLNKKNFNETKHEVLNDLKNLIRDIELLQR
jgi:hypothetical protein